MQQRYSAVRQLSIRFHPLGNPRDGENIQLFVCALLLVEDITGTSFLPGPGEKSDLRFKFSVRSLTRKNPLEMFSEYQGSNTVYLEWSRCTLQSTKGRMEGRADRWVKEGARKMVCDYRADRADEILLPWQLPSTPSALVATNHI